MKRSTADNSITEGPHREKSTAAPQPETDFDATHRDDYAGQGGEYQIRDGKRVLLQRTRTTPPKAGGRRVGDPAAE
jgi:hypothetical protein